MILITGAAGFIGSALIWKLNSDGVKDIIAVGNLGSGEKWKNLRKRNFYNWIGKDEIFDWLEQNADKVNTIIHLGACTDTTEQDVDFLIANNVKFSQRLWEVSTQKEIPFIYASSGATYGSGELGYKDDHEIISSLKPLNPYGWSKQLFDKWVLDQDSKPPQWVGLKFFNVYGPNEYHKGQMSSVAYHAFQQAKQNGVVKLFKSYKQEFDHGEQRRDFIYVKDVVNVVTFFLSNQKLSGIYNVGTGDARTFNDLVKSIFASLNQEPKIEYIDMPDYLINQYQYSTEADIKKLRDVGYKEDFYTLEEGIKDYVQNYLDTPDPYL